MATSSITANFEITDPKAVRVFNGSLTTKSRYETVDSLYDKIKAYSAVQGGRRSVTTAKDAR